MKFVTQNLSPAAKEEAEFSTPCPKLVTDTLEITKSAELLPARFTRGQQLTEHTHPHAAIQGSSDGPLACAHQLGNGKPLFLAFLCSKNLVVKNQMSPTTMNLPTVKTLGDARSSKSHKVSLVTVTTAEDKTRLSIQEGRPTPLSGIASST